MPSKLRSDYKPQGDQPRAIAELISGIGRGDKHQTLLGVTGSGKTFTIANVVDKVQKPTLVIAHNKTLAGQLYGEFKELFPENAVEFFVSYYDYYQPEAYVPSSDTYIEKDSTINDEIDRLRHSATHALLTRNDVLIVASVSCIYGLGTAEAYYELKVALQTGEEYPRHKLLRDLVEIQYERNDHDFSRGTFRVKGDTIEIFPAYEEERAIRVELFGDMVESIKEIDPLRGKVLGTIEKMSIFPSSHYVTSGERRKSAIVAIREELRGRLIELRGQDKLLEAQRLEQRTMFDLEMIEQMGFCNGIENYSRHLSGRSAGEPPPTLLDYFPKDFLLVIDESHQSVPQIGAMYRGDRSRKETLVEYGFRLPSALDNRPLQFGEVERLGEQGVFVFRHPLGVRDAEERRGDRRADHPSHRAGRSGGRSPPGGAAGRRPAGGSAQAGDPGAAGAGDHADQEDGRGPDRVLRRPRRAGPVHALGHRHARATGAGARPAAGVVRRADRHQPPPRGPGHPGGVAGRGAGRRQGRLPAIERVADPDHRPGRAQRRGAGDPVRGHRDGLDQGCARGDGPAQGQAGGLQPGARHHAAVGEARHPRHGHPRRRLRRRRGSRRKGRAGRVPAREPEGRAEGDRRARGRDARQGRGAGLRGRGDAPRQGPGHQGPGPGDHAQAAGSAEAGSAGGGRSADAPRRTEAARQAERASGAAQVAGCSPRS